MDTPKTNAPLTKKYLLERLNALEKSINENRYHEERLTEEINKLDNQRKMYRISLAPELEERNHLLKLYQELGGNESEIRG